MNNATLTAELPTLPQTNYRNGQKSLEIVRAAIAKKYGEEEAANFNPLFDARTFKAWKEIGYAVTKGETAIRSFIMVKPKGAKKEDNKLVPKNIFLFHRRQVQQIQ